MQPARPIRVLLADPGGVSRDRIIHLLDRDGRFQVVATASDGVAAADTTARLRPDVVVMNLRLPPLDGIAATRRIMAETPTPVVIVSTSGDGIPTERAAEALQAGAVSVLDKPLCPDHAQYAQAIQELLTSIRLMAEVKVVRRPASGGRRHLVLLPPHEPLEKRRPVVLVMTASTGGPQAIQTVLQALGADLDVPVLIVQHMSKGFLPGMVGWLDGTCPQVGRRGAADWRQRVHRTRGTPPAGHPSGQARADQGAPCRRVSPFGRYAIRVGRAFLWC